MGGEAGALGLREMGQEDVHHAPMPFPSGNVKRRLLAVRALRFSECARKLIVGPKTDRLYFSCVTTLPVKNRKQMVIIPWVSSWVGSPALLANPSPTALKIQREGLDVVKQISAFVG